MNGISSVLDSSATSIMEILVPMVVLMVFGVILRYVWEDLVSHEVETKKRPKKETSSEISKNVDRSKAISVLDSFPIDQSLEVASKVSLTHSSVLNPEVGEKNQKPNIMLDKMP